MKKLAIFSTLFVALLALTACENRNVTHHHPNPPPPNERPLPKERPFPPNPNQTPPVDREQLPR